MFTLNGKFLYRSQPLPEGPEHWWPTRVYANITWALENHPDFPERLCPDAWKWHRTIPYDQLPLTMTHVPRGSWLAARLVHIAGSEMDLGQHLTTLEKPNGEHEFSLPLSVTTPDGDEQVAAVAVIFDREQIRIEGHALPEIARELDDDLMTVFCRNALVDLKVCQLVLDNTPVGWDGMHFYGEEQRSSRFEEIVAEEKRVGDLAQQEINLEPGDDSRAEDPALLQQVAEYLRLETADGQFIRDNLQYLRSARIEDVNYLVWSYHELDGTKCYVTYSDGPRGSVLGMNDAGNLTPEQYVFGDFMQWF